MSESMSPRARARADTIEQIKDIARSRLSTDGPDLSLRAVARDLGVVSSGVYRYFASRDELLTALILDGYDSMGAAVEQAEGAIARRDVTARWQTMSRATRAWSLERPHEFALLYGSPVPGYAAPQDTIAAASRVLVVAMQILHDGIERGAIDVPSDRLPRAVRTDVERVRDLLGFPSLPAPLISRTIAVWAQLFGTIGFELFGRYTNAILDLEAQFEHQLKMMTRYLGLG